MIFTEEQRDIMRLAIDTYGEVNQTDKAIEEMAELTKALIKLKQVNLGDYEEQTFKVMNVEEEIADVLIMMEQLTMIFKPQDKDEPTEIQININHKIERLARNLHREV